MPSPPLIALHALLLCLGAYLVGRRVYRETHAQVGEATDSLQSRRVATAATIALFLLMVLLIVQADLALFRAPGPVQ